MRTLTAALILAWSLALLVACGPARPKLEPPRVRIAQLDLSDPESPAPQRFELALRVRNTSEADLPAHDQRLELVIDGHLAAVLEITVNVDIPALGSEEVRVEGRLEARDVAALQSVGQGRRSQVPYELKGEARAVEFSLDLAYEGWLSATPGRPGSFR